MEYNEEDFTIPVTYKDKVVAYSTKDPNCRTFKFIDEDKGPKVLYEEPYGERELTIMSVGNPNEDGIVTEVTNWLILDNDDIERLVNAKKKES